MISGILIGVLMTAFIGITLWAYSSRQRERFEQAARLPLEDEGVLATDPATRNLKSKVQP